MVNLPNLARATGPTHLNSWVRSTRRSALGELAR